VSDLNNTADATPTRRAGLPAPLWHHPLDDEPLMDLHRRLVRLESLIGPGLPSLHTVVLPLMPVAPDDHEALEAEITAQEAKLAELHARRGGGPIEWPKMVSTPSGDMVAESPEHEAELQKLPAPEQTPEASFAEKQAEESRAFAEKQAQERAAEPRPAPRPSPLPAQSPDPRLPPRPPAPRPAAPPV
jgi:hypothetical protein